MARARLQVSIRLLMLLVVIAAGLAWLVKYESPFLLIPLAIFVGMAAFYWRIAQGNREFAARAFGAVAALDSLAASLSCALLIGLSAPLVMALALVCFLPPTVGFGIAWAFEATRSGVESRRSPWLAWPLVTALAVLPLTMLFDPWPFRLAFMVSRPALDALADDLVQGVPLSLPRQAGFYRIIDSKYDPSNQEVALLIGPDRGFSGTFRVGPESDHASIATRTLTWRSMNSGES